MDEINYDELIDTTPFLCQGMLNYAPTEEDLRIIVKTTSQRLIFNAPVTLTNYEAEQLAEFRKYVS